MHTLIIILYFDSTLTATQMTNKEITLYLLKQTACIIAVLGASIFLIITSL